MTPNETREPLARPTDWEEYENSQDWRRQYKLERAIGFANRMAVAKAAKWASTASQARAIAETATRRGWLRPKGDPEELEAERQEILSEAKSIAEYGLARGLLSKPTDK